MIDKIQTLLNKTLERIKSASNTEALREIEIEVLGRKGSLTSLLREVPKLPIGDRPQAGKTANIAKKQIEEALAHQFFALEEKALSNIEETEWIDITFPGKKIQHGKRHPLHVYMEDMVDVFRRMGFERAEGPEIEDDWHNFTALNIPPHHPAREMQDTFMIADPLKGYVLRTQTSDVQIHFMEKRKPPFRVVAPGKVYRKDSDATHSPMFHQIEGLMVDKNISLSHLRFVLLTALKELISVDIDLRFRLSFFPFTEPSLEVDALLTTDEGKKWLEIGGAGMVHPNVLKNGGLDPAEWNGFAFGFGIERQVMIKYGVKDLRLFFENDLRFLEQF